jgi:hypothetical protein
MSITVEFQNESDAERGMLDAMLLRVQLADNARARRVLKRRGEDQIIAAANRIMARNAADLGLRAIMQKGRLCYA